MYKFFDKVYEDWDSMVQGVMADYPEYCYNSDAMVDFIEAHLEEVENEV